MILVLCAVVVCTTRCFVFSLTLLLVLMFCFSVLFSIVITSLGEKRSIWFLCICMFILDASLVIFFSSSWCRGSAVDSDCDFSFNVLMH